MSVGTSAATMTRNVGVPAAPLGAARNVFAVWEAKLAGSTDRVPPSVRLPVVVTVPESVSPLIVPVPPTLVTVPVVELVPAPIAVLNDAAVNVDTVLSALICGKVIAVGFASVKKFAPTVVAPRPDLPPAAVEAPVPPLATATMPVTLAAVPVVFWLRVGTSAATSERKVGVPAAPLGPAKTVFANCDENVAVRVPEVVTGEPEIVNTDTGSARPTEVTVAELVPAPIAVLNVAASSADTVLSALMRGKVIAVGFGRVKKFAPTVVPPRAVTAPGADAAPVPPLAMGSVPVTCVVRPILP